MAKMLFQGNTRTSPVWAGDFGGREHIMPFPGKLDVSKFTDQAGIVVTVGNAGAAQNATTVPIAALTLSSFANTIVIAQGNVLIPSGTVLDFGGGKFARLTADAVYGATSLTVSALVTALVSADTATYTKYGTLYVPSGTPIGRTAAMRAANSPWIPAVSTHDEIYLTMFDVADLRTENDVEFYRHDSLVKENYLPAWAVMNADSGLADPAVAAVPTAAGTDGTLVAGTYSVGYTFVSTTGETKISPTATVVVGATNHIAIADIAFPTGATAIRFYISSTPGDPVMSFAKELVAHAATTILAPATGTRPPSANTTQGASGAVLQRIRTLYQCITGVD